MKTMFIAYGGSMHRGFFMGDVLAAIKVATCFVENEPHDHIILSQHDDPLNFLWDKFIRENNVEVINGGNPIGDQFEQYRFFDEVRKKREVYGRRFDTYKELYARMHGGYRQTELAGFERGLRSGAQNIFEYYLYGQESYPHAPFLNTRDFGRDVADMPEWDPPTEPSVFVAPWEKCHGNNIFTPAFWSEVVTKLEAAKVKITINDDRRVFAASTYSTIVFPSFRELPLVMSRHTLTTCGNTGTGWVAGAGEYPLVAAEWPAQTYPDYHFDKCCLRSLKATVRKPDSAVMARTILEEIEKLA